MKPRALLGLLMPTLLCLLIGAPAFAGGTGSLDLDGTERVADGTDVAIDADNGFLIVWLDGPSVIARELSSTGVPSGAPALLADIAQRFGQVAARHVNGSEFVVAWSDAINNYQYFGNDYEIFAQRLDGTTPIGSKLEMEEASQDSDGLVGIETREDGHFMVVRNWGFNYGPAGRRV